MGDRPDAQTDRSRRRRSVCRYVSAISSSVGGWEAAHVEKEARQMEELIHDRLTVRRGPNAG